MPGDARITDTSDSPVLAPARATLTVAVIIGMMTALWNSELAASRAMLAALGATPRWLRSLGGTLAAGLAVVGLVGGGLWGALAGRAYITVSNLHSSWTPAPLVSTLIGCAVAAAVGAALTSGRAHAARRA